MTVLEATDERASDGCIMWKCKCDCGNIHFVNTNSLKNGDIQSCGCQRSRGEAKINAILFPNQYKLYSNLKRGSVIRLYGKVEKRLSEYQLIANKIEIL